MSNRYLLLKQFLRNPAQVGAIAPSGAALCRELVTWLELDKVSAVAELGPGTGVVTQEILRQLNPDARFFAVELDEAICREFAAVLPQVKLFNANACELAGICAGENIRQLDAVVSGLPWAAFPETLQRSILEAVIRSLGEGGKFSTFAYLQGLVLPAGYRFRKLLEEYFAQVELSHVVWNNLPPAIVYRCTK